MRAPACFEDPEAKKLIKRLCKEHRIDELLLADLVGVVQQYSGSGRRECVTSDVSSAIDRFLIDRDGV